MILLWGLPGDDPFDQVSAALRRQRVPFVRLDQRELLTWDVELLDDASALTLATPAYVTRLAADASAYVRVYDLRELPFMRGAARELLSHAEQLEARLWTFIELLTGRVLNRPEAMATNNSKPYQSQLIARHGFRVPETVVTTCPSAARAFWERHGRVIYKSVSGVRSVVSRLGPDDVARLADVTWCPTQLQAWVPGRDVRVHVVGDDVFAVAITSEADDYRYAGRQGASADLAATTLPDDVAERCHRTAHALSLPLAGLDLRVTPEGEWFCFEVNPSPCFTYYEAHTGQPLTEAVASYLATHQ